MSVLATANLAHEHDEFSGCFRFYPRPAWSLAVQRSLKRGIDLLVGIVGSAVTLLLMPALFVLVNLEERGPLFYRSAYLARTAAPVLPEVQNHARQCGPYLRDRREAT